MKTYCQKRRYTLLQDHRRLRGLAKYKHFYEIFILFMDNLIFLYFQTPDHLRLLPRSPLLPRYHYQKLLLGPLNMIIIFFDKWYKKCG